MLFNRILPDTNLKNYIECYWTIDNDDPAINTQKIIPDGFPEIIIHYGDPYRININDKWEVQSKCLVKDVIFSRRDLKTIENILSCKYNFNSRSGITFRARHYWSKVVPRQLYDLQPGGDLLPTTHTGILLTNENINFFNIDALYTWEFAPGSFINISWKQQGSLDDEYTRHTYFKNFDRTISSPQNNNFSIKVIYYIDYLDLKKGNKRK